MIGAVIGGATALAGGIQAAIGAHRQKQLEKNRPVYEIPEEIRQNLTQAQQQSLQGVPEAQRQNFLQNLQRGSAQALQNLGSRKSGLAGIGMINQQQNDAYGNLMSSDAQARQQNQGALMNQRQNMADYKDQAFQFNKVNPFNRATDRNQALIGAGMQNISSGLQMGLGSLGGGNKQTPAAEDNSNQQSASYWDNKLNNNGMTNYNPNSNNGFGSYQYQGTQYGSTV